MSVERTIPRYEFGEDRVAGLNNLREILDLASVVAKKGKIHKGLQDGDINAVFVGDYGGNKYQVEYRVFCKGDFEESKITGQDIGITVFYGHLVIPPFRVTVDYYYGKKDVKEVLNGLKPLIKSTPEEQTVESQIISRDNNAPIAILAILGGAHYIFARTSEEAGHIYSVWCEENEDFYNMRRALTDVNSKLTPFCIRPLELFPYYLKAAEERILRESQGKDPQRRLLYWLNSNQFLHKT